VVDPALGCPSCGSSNVKRLSLVHREGLATSSSVTGAIGFAGGHVAVGHGTTRSAHQTLLSRQFAPPHRKSMVWPWVGMVFSGFGTLSAVLGGLGDTSPNASAGRGVMGMMLAIYVPVFLLSFRAYWNGKRHNEQYPRQLLVWDNSYMCGRCGEVFVPAEKGVAR
jgi:hypothetical protein